MENQNAIGAQVRRYRSGQDLTQEAFVARCGVLGWRLSRGTLAKIEAQVRCVSDAELYVLARALKKPMEELFPVEKQRILEQLNQSDG